MTPGARWSVPGRAAPLGLAALASLALHGAGFAAILWVALHAPREPALERGVEIVWDQDAAEAVSAAEAPANPGAPPETAAPPMAEAPPPQPAAPAIAPPPPAFAPPTPLALDLPRHDLPLPDLRVAPPIEAPPEPPREVRQALAPPEPPPAPPEPLTPEPPPPEPLTPEPLTPEPPPPEPPRQQAQRPRPAPPPRPQPTPPAPRSPAPAEASRAGEEAAAQLAAGIGRATGAVVPPGPDPRYQNAAPGYPEAARLRGEQGSVALELSVGTDGRVITVMVARSSGSPMLDAAARRSVLEWRFRPAMRDGQPVPGTIRTQVHFRLQ